MDGTSIGGHNSIYPYQADVSPRSDFAIYRAFHVIFSSSSLHRGGIATHTAAPNAPGNGTNKDEQGRRMVGRVHNAPAAGRTGLLVRMLSFLCCFLDLGTCSQCFCSFALHLSPLCYPSCSEGGFLARIICGRRRLAAWANTKRKPNHAARIPNLVMRWPTPARARGVRQRRGRLWHYAAHAGARLAA